jgi:hypothetical protein
MSGDAAYLRDFHRTLSCNLEIALLTVLRVALQPLATSTADPFRFRNLDRWNITSLYFALVPLSKASRYPCSSKS